MLSLQLRHYERDGVSNHQLHDCLLRHLFSRSSKKTSKLRVTGLCEGNSPVTGEFPAQRTSNAESVSIWWLHHDCGVFGRCKWSPKLLGYHMGEHGLEDGSNIHSIIKRAFVNSSTDQVPDSVSIYRGVSFEQFNVVLEADIRKVISPSPTK